MKIKNSTVMFVLITVIFLIVAMGCEKDPGQQKRDATGGSVESTVKEGERVEENKTSTEKGELKEKSEPVSRLVTENGRTYIEVEGQPYLMYGVQMRLDDFLAGDMSPRNVSKLGVYFQKAKEAGFNTVVIPMPWKYIEVVEGVYDFKTYLNKVINYADMYNLRVQLQWFGSAFCTWPNEAPDYIQVDRDTYKRVKGKIKGSEPFDFTCKPLLEKEYAAFRAMMDHIATYDVRKRVIMVTTVAEPDNPETTDELWAGGQKEAILDMIGKLSDIVHESGRDVVARTYYTWNIDNADDIFEIGGGKDIVGRDPYRFDINEFKSMINQYEIPGNLSHAAENGAQYKNLINLVLAAFDEGAGYLLYELRTTGGWRNYDFGLYRKTEPYLDEWIERDGSAKVAYFWDEKHIDTEVRMDEVRAFNKLIYKADRKIALSPKDKNAAFNLGNSETMVDETKQVGSKLIRYFSKIGGEAFAIEDDSGDIILISLKDGSAFTFDVPLLQGNTFSIGYYDTKNEWIEESAREFDDTTVVLNANEVARVPAVMFTNK